MPKQLKAINKLGGSKHTCIDIVALPLRLRVTVNYSDGTWRMVDINNDGEVTVVHDGK